MLRCYGIAGAKSMIMGARANIFARISSSVDPEETSSGDVSENRKQVNNPCRLKVRGRALMPLVFRKAEFGIRIILSECRPITLAPNRDFFP